MKNTAKVSMFMSALIACAALSACGSQKQPAPTTTSAATATTVKVAAPAKKPTFTLTYSVYAGWMPYYLMVKNGTLKKWADKEGINIVPKPLSYGASITAFATGDSEGTKGAQALTVASMDALMALAATGKDITVVIMGDYSDGNDAILARNGKTLKDLEAGSKIMLMEKSVSEYVVRRCCEINKLNPSKIKFTNAPDDRIQSMYKTTPTQNLVCTWNPMVHEIMKEKGVKKLFDSHQLQGEIQDLLVIDSKTVKDHPEFARAITGAWYETMQLMTNGDAATKKSALAYMAQESGDEVTVKDLSEQLETTHMFYDPADAATFTESKELREYVARVHTFCRNNDMLPPGAKPIGISFPAGDTDGNAKNVKLRYDSRFMREAANGSL